MRHARNDYNRIQDPAGLIPEDEPVFLFRGQDKYASAILRFYASLVAADKPASPIVKATLRQADAMDAWGTKKAPDMLDSSQQKDTQ